jgi:hypothetical protein
MPEAAPLRVPAELRRAGPAKSGRWFRTARSVSVEGLRFGVALPEALDGPIEVAFVLPDDEEPVTGRGVVEELRRDDDLPPVRLALRFVGLEEPTRARIARYVEERLAVSHGTPSPSA